MRTLILLLALLSVASAACSGSITKYVPAVVGSDGELVNVTMSLVPGDGSIFVSVYPRTGIMTQDSVEQAVVYAGGLAGAGNDCDVLVNFGDNPSTNLIDGPSAGTALTVMAYSLLSGKPERNDTIITGTIDQSGEVGPVGGLYEKASGAARMGADYFITPVENFYELLLLKQVERDYGIKVIQAGRVEDVIAFMTENRSIDQQPLGIRNRPVPQAPPYDSSAISGLGPLAQTMIGLEDNLTGSMNGTDDTTTSIRGFFSNEVQRQKSIAGSGYLFTAANEAFLNYIDLSTIRIILQGNVDLPRAKGEVGKCLTGMQRPVMTERNFEWVIGSDLRREWALDKLGSIKSGSNMIEDEKFVQYNDLMYAQAWCTVGRGLLAAAPTGGTPINESAWKDLADSELSEARGMGTTSEDTATKLGTAQSSYQAGHYGAAIYDAVYVIQTEKSLRGRGANASFLGSSMSSLWGNVYESHATFLKSQNQTASAVSTESYALALDEATAKMRSLMQALPGNGTAAEEPQQPAQDSTLLAYAAAGISIFLLIVVVILLLSGNGDNRKGPLKAYRAKQKEGRA